MLLKNGLGEKLQTCHVIRVVLDSFFWDGSTLTHMTIQVTQLRLNSNPILANLTQLRLNSKPNLLTWLNSDSTHLSQS